jgi:hypothetical protein
MSAAEECQCEVHDGKKWYCHLHRQRKKRPGSSKFAVPNPRTMHFLDGRRILKPHIETTYCAQHGCVPVPAAPLESEDGP